MKNLRRSHDYGRRGSAPAPFTVAEVEAMVAAGVMDEDERVELIGGSWFPCRRREANTRRSRARSSTAGFARPKDCRLTQETTFRLSEDTYLEPDIVIYPRATGLRGPTGANVLLVVEISDSSQRYDMGRKAALYASFGVRELWVIDAARLAARVFRDPAPDGYCEAGDIGAAPCAAFRAGSVCASAR